MMDRFGGGGVFVRIHCSWYLVLLLQTKTCCVECKFGVVGVDT